MALTGTQLRERDGRHDLMHQANLMKKGPLLMRKKRRRPGKNRMNEDCLWA